MVEERKIEFKQVMLTDREHAVFVQNDSHRTGGECYFYTTPVYLGLVRLVPGQIPDPEYDGVYSGIYEEWWPHYFTMESDGLPEFPAEQPGFLGFWRGDPEDMDEENTDLFNTDALKKLGINKGDPY